MKKGCRVGGDSEEQGGHLPCQHRAQCFVGSGGESCYNWGQWYLPGQPGGSFSRQVEGRVHCACVCVWSLILGKDVAN